MPFSMPMWPLVLGTPGAAGSAVRRRWIIVDDTVRHEVDESEYRSALASCLRVEIARDPQADIVINLCFRTPP
jgi:hypothetical protein